MGCARPAEKDDFTCPGLGSPKTHLSDFRSWSNQVKMFPSSQKYDCSPPTRPSPWARPWAQGREAWQEVLPHELEAGTRVSIGALCSVPLLWLLQKCKKSGRWLCVSLDSACSLLTICPGWVVLLPLLPTRRSKWPAAFRRFGVDMAPQVGGEAGAEAGESTPSWQPLQHGLGNDIQGSHAGYPELCSLLRPS